jgi:hypothetical protein
MLRLCLLAGVYAPCQERVRTTNTPRYKGARERTTMNHQDRALQLEQEFQLFKTKQEHERNMNLHDQLTAIATAAETVAYIAQTQKPATKAQLMAVVDDLERLVINLQKGE